MTSRTGSGISVHLKKQKALSTLMWRLLEVTTENFGLRFCCFELLHIAKTSSLTKTFFSLLPLDIFFSLHLVPDLIDIAMFHLTEKPFQLQAFSLRGVEMKYLEPVGSKGLQNVAHRYLQFFACFLKSLYSTNFAIESHCSAQINLSRFEEVVGM